MDKTDLIHQIVRTGGYYFLSRPRRFGKSLLISTMEAYFQGKKELFKGLAIENLEKDWTEYPVLHLDLSGVTYTDENVLNEKMESALSQWEQKYGIANTFTVDGIRFENIIKTAYEKTGKPVVILIDEYDKPLLDSAGNEALREAFRSRLQGFYSVMKSQDGKLRFGFLTGVTKLGKLSIFSGLNNLNDISMNFRYADICGISEKDLHAYFDESVREMAERLLRWLPFLPKQSRHLQSFQSAECLEPTGIQRLLVRNRHAHLRGQGPAERQVQLGRFDAGRSACIRLGRGQCR